MGKGGGGKKIKSVEDGGRVGEYKIREGNGERKTGGGDEEGKRNLKGSGAGRIRKMAPC